MSLSEKRGEINRDKNNNPIWAYKEEDVREFIKRLKNIVKAYTPIPDKLEKIDKLAGEDLI